MKQRFFLLLVLVSFLFLGTHPETLTHAQISPEGGSVQAEITPVMGYQGRLVEAGTPVTGNRSMVFALYNAETSGTLIWSESKTVSVSNGLFQTALGDTTPFSETIRASMNQNLWLQVTVAGTTLPRQRLMGAPFAFTLAPGAVIEGTQPQYMLNVQNDTTDGTGLYARGKNGIYASATTGVGVEGYSTSGHGVLATGEGSGLAGAALEAQAYGPSGVALWAQANSSSYSAVVDNDGGGLALSVDGQGGGIYSTGNKGVGVFGSSSSYYGLYGYSGSSIGVLAQSNGTALNGAALKAEALGASGIGVYAFADSTDSSIVSINEGTGPLLKAFGGNGGNEEFIVLNDGTVKQALAADGLVKAAVFAYCMLDHQTVYRYFNNVGGTISASLAEWPNCWIDFGFNLSDRFWVSNGNCGIDYDYPNRLLCGMSDYLMILVY